MKKATDVSRNLGSSGSIMSIGSSGSILSIGSTGSILSIGSSGSILSIGSAGSVLSIGSFLSAGPVLSAGRARLDRGHPVPRPAARGQTSRGPAHPGLPVRLYPPGRRVAEPVDGRHRRAAGPQGGLQHGPAGPSGARVRRSRRGLVLLAEPVARRAPRPAP